MVKKSALSKKLASYSALAAAVLGVNHEVDAQIIYTNVNPAITVPNSAIYRADYNVNDYLDLNNDGINDFQFSASGNYNVLTKGTTQSSYASHVEINVKGMHSDSVYPAGVFGVDLIPSSLANTWATSAQLAQGFRTRRTGAGSHSTYSSQGPFANVTNKYLPLEFVNNGNTYYGWVRLTTNKARQITVQDYAYNSVPNSPIASGSTGCNFTPVNPVVTVNNDTLESTPATKYQWYLDGNPVPGDTLAKAARLQQGFYAVLTTDANGCLSQSQAHYFSCYSVQPLVSVGLGFSDTTCVSAELQADNLISGTYIQWLRNGDTLSAATAAIYLADSSGSYSAEFIDSGKTCYLTSNAVQLFVKPIIPQPLVSTTNQTTILCPGGMLAISLTDSAEYNPSDTLQWYFNGTPINGANKSLYSIDTTGSYFLSVTNDGCYKYSDTIVISEDIQSPTIALGGSDTLKTQKYNTYTWYLDSVAAGGTGQSFIADTDGKYFVIITDSNGCTFKSPDYDFVPTGIVPTISEQVNIYAYDKRLHVLFTDEDLIGSPLKIYNTLGQQVFATTLTTGQTEIDVTSFASGLYVVEVAGGKTASIIKKIVIE